MPQKRLIQVFAILLIFFGISRMATASPSFLTNYGGGLIYDSSQNITWLDQTFPSVGFPDAQSFADGFN